MAPFWELKSITGPNSLIKTSPFFQKYAKIGLNIMKKCILSMLGCFNLNPLEKKRHKYIRIEIVKMSLTSYYITLHIRTKGILSPCMLYKTHSEQTHQKPTPKPYPKYIIKLLNPIFPITSKEIRRATSDRDNWRERSKRSKATCFQQL